MLQVALRSGNRVLPLHIWRAACVCCAVWLHASVQIVQEALKDTDESLAAALHAAQQVDNAQGAGELPVTAMPAARVLMMQAMLCAVISAMNENTVEVRLPPTLSCGCIQKGTSCVSKGCTV